VQIKKIKNAICLLILIVGLTTPNFGLGVMSSDHYQILGDQIGIGAGESTGGAYTLHDSSGALITAGVIDSNTYEIRSGFYFMDSGVLSVSVSPSSLNLGSLSASEVKTAQTTITVSTDSTTGYSLAIGSVGSGGLANVATGQQVVAGTEAFGFSGSGADYLFSSSTDKAVSAGLTFASKSSVATYSQTVLTFKAAISNSTTSTASGQKTISFIASANF